MKKVILLIVMLCATGFTLNPSAGLDSTYGQLVSAEGAITLPDDFRANYRYQGSWFVPEGGPSGFHDVYTQPESVAAYRKTGQFPDGTVLVKE